MRRFSRSTACASIVLTSLLALAGCSPEKSSESFLAEAKQYQQKGDYKAALIQLKNAASKNPGDAKIRFELAQSYLESGDPVSAEKEIRKAQSLGMDGKQVIPVLTNALLMQGKAEQALEVSNDAPASPELLVTRGNAYAATGAEAKAAESYEGALTAQPNDANALIGLARLAMARKDVAAASSHIEKALAANPKNPAVWMFKGAMLRADGKTDEAVAAYGEVIKIKPDHMNALVERAQISIERQKYEAAQADLAAAGKAAPNALIVRYSQALLDFRQGKFGPAKETLQQVMKVAPNYMPAVLLSGAVDLNLKSYQQAEQHLKRFVEQFPDNAYARKLLAQAQLQNARPADATATLAPLLKNGEDDGQLMTLAGMSAAQAKDFGKATGYLERASVLDPTSAALRTSLGLTKISGGNTEAGVNELAKAVELNPASADALLALVRAQIGLRQFDKALATIAQGEKHHASNSSLYNLKAGAYLGKRDQVNARVSFEKAAALQPADFTPVLNLTQLDLREKGPSAAKQRLEAFAAKHNKNANVKFALAELATGQGQKDQATAWLEKAAADDPSAIEPAIRLGAHYLATQQVEKALTLARKARTTNPDSPQLADLLGQAQIANKDFGAALETYSALATSAPKSAAAQVRLARVHVLMKDLPAAEADLKRAVALEPEFLPGRLAQVELAVGMGKANEALEMGRQMQTAFPKSPVGFTVEGDVQAHLKRPEQAVQAYRKALALGKSSALAVKVAESLRQSGKLKEAEGHLTEWTKANPADTVSLMYLAELHLANKQYKPAAQLFENLLKQKPEDPILLNNLAWSYQQLKDTRALPTAERAVKLAPANPAVLDTLGWMLAEQGDTARALPLLKKAVSAAPEAGDIRYHLAATLHQSGDKAGARKELEKLLSYNKPFAQVNEAQALLKQL